VLKTNRQTISGAQLVLRDMHTKDLNQVLLIERNAQISPWSRLSFEESLTKQNICRVLETNKEIIAYHVVCPIEDELHILNDQNLNRIFLEVRASNEVAMNLYAQWSFKQISIRKAYYRSSARTNGLREDALIFMREVR